MQRIFLCGVAIATSLFAAACGGSTADGSAGAGGSVAGASGHSGGSGSAAGSGGTGAGGAGSLHWYMTCGDPICRDQNTPFDDPSIPNCTSQQMGDSCNSDGERCDGIAGCGVTLICSASDPTMGPGGCPISRARFKQGVSYLTPEQRRAVADALLGIPLASYTYKHDPGAGPQLGFLIDDIEPSAAVSGDHVNLYGYLSMTVAAVQDQQHQIAELQREVAALRNSQRSDKACPR